MSRPRANRIYEFENFRLNAAHLLLYQGEYEVSLAPKVVETLLALVERPGEVLSKDELMQIVWTDLNVEENNLSQNIYRLRKVLNRSVEIRGRPLIETLKRRGYRFNGAVRIIDSAISKADSSNGVQSEVWVPSSLTRPNRKGKSLVVLPFANLSGKADDEYFCDGLAEELLNALAKIEDLKVVARTSAFAFKNKNIEVSEIGKTLKVDTILEGSVRRSGDRLRITAQLIDSLDGYHLWSERFEPEMGDIFDVQDEITISVVKALKLKLFGDERSAVLKRGTNDTQAYELYLRGLFYFYKRTTDDLKNAIKLFIQAIEIDPNYALAFVGLADCYLLIVVYTGTPADEVMPAAKVAATRAVEIDESLAEAHATLGHFHFRALEWPQAEREIERAIEINQNYAAGHFWYSEYFRAQRRFDDAFREIERAQELDLLSPSYRTFVGVGHFNLGNLDAAILELQRVLEISPTFLMAHFFLTEAYLKIGHCDEAISMARNAVDLSERGSLFLGGLGYAYARAGERAPALEVVKELKEKHSKGEAVGFHFAQVHTGLKENLKAITWLEQDFEAGNTLLLTNVTTSYFYDHLYDEPRYQDLLLRIGINKKMLKSRGQ